MTKKLILLTLLAFAFTSVFAQDTTMLMLQANKMVKAVITKDYEAIVDGLYPKFVEMNGGKVVMIEGMKTVMENPQTISKFRILDAKLGTPGPFFEAGDEIHCIIPETITIKVKKGTAIATSSILAVSNNNGKNWYFIDVNEKNRGKLDELLPEINEDMVIPDATQPVFYPD